MDKLYVAKAIRLLKPTAEFSLTNGDYKSIKWDVLESEPPTEAEILAAIEKVKSNQIQSELEKVNAKNALLERLGITAEEAALLIS